MVWRVAHDRVLVRRVTDGVGAELTGLAGAVWVVAGEPADTDEIAAQLGTSPSGVASIVADLVDAGWLHEVVG